VHDVADASRAALDEFLALDPQDVHALSRWFAGPYRRGVSFAGRRRGSTGPRGAVPYTPIPELVSSAKATVRAVMAAAARPGAEGLVAVLPSVVDVVPTRDVFGAHGFAPLNLSHTRLATRVLTLLIADYLTRPDGYLADPPRRPNVHSLPAAKRLAGAS
jgi:hypothetical protein